MHNQIVQTGNGQFQKGMTPWNKGVHGRQKNHNTGGLKLGQGWNKGLKLPQMSGKNHWNWKGATFCECGNSKSTPAKNCKTCAAKHISLRMRGNKHSLGHKHSEETKKILSVNRVNNPIQVYKDTKIERVIESLLIKNRIPFDKQVPLCKVTVSDFYIERYNIAIFCDGCYWHGCKLHRSIDNSVELNRNQNKILIENGISVVRIWEHDILSKPESCIGRIIKLINFKQKHDR